VHQASLVPHDFAINALRAVEQTIGEKLDDPDAGKNPHAVALGRLGGVKGGKARAANLTKRKLKAIGKKGAARWGKKD
jgi:hypothetical protein